MKRIYLLTLSVLCSAIAIAQSAKDYSYEKTTYFNYVDGEEVPVASTKAYYDVLGRPMQNSDSLFEENKVAITQQLYDLRGRAAVTTLPGIVDGSMDYRNDFILNISGDRYGTDDYDGTNLYNPTNVSDLAGTLGGYYSENNTEEPYVPSIDYPYSRSWSEPSPDPRSSVLGLPGDEFRMGSGREIKARIEPFTIGDFSDYLDHYYKLKPHFVTSSVEIADEQGYKSISTNQDGQESIRFADVDGKTIVTGLISGATYEYLSYTYYDDLGRVVAEVAPNGVDLTDNITKPEFATEYTYNARGWLVATTSPDEGLSEFVYSTDGKLRFSQSALQRASTPTRFSYTLYDEYHRLVESGEYTSAGASPYVFENQATDIQGATSIHRIVNELGAAGNLQDCVPGTAGCNKSDVSWITYDLQSPDFPTDAEHLAQGFTEGQITNTENENVKTWYSYDELGRMVFEIREIKALNKLISIDYTYDFAGNLLGQAYQKGVPNEAYYHHYSYDADQRLKLVHTSLDGDESSPSYWLHATYHYYPHGPLKRVELATDLQGIDYMYTSTGALKAINAVDPAYDPGGDGANEFYEDVMGIQYDYYPGDFDRQNVITQAVPLDANLVPANYNGSLRAVTWGRGEYKEPIPAPSMVEVNEYDEQETEVQATQKVVIKAGLQPFVVTAEQGFRASVSPDAAIPQPLDNVKTYAYKYDERNQLDEAIYGEDGVIVDIQEAYRVKDLSYDENGNIQSLTRYDEAADVLHNLQYVYEAEKNQLTSITGYASYTYDEIGRVIGIDFTDVSKDDFYLTYDVSDKVTAVHSSASRLPADLLLSYLYDESGFRLMERNEEHDIETWYIRNTAGQVQSYYYKVGGTYVHGSYPIYGAGRLGMATRFPDHLKYYYELNDHQGNVRQVMTKLKYMATATMENTEPNKSWEETPGQGGFGNMESRHVDQPWNSTPGGAYVAWLNPQNNGPAVGPTKELQVQAGDKIKLSVQAAYGVPNTDNAIPADVIGSLVATAMGYDLAVTETVQKYSAAVEAAATASTVVGVPGDPRTPKAYLQLLFFDKNLNYIPPTGDETHHVAVTDAAGNTLQDLQNNSGLAEHEQLELEFDVPEDGYVFIYVANESTNGVDVYFDDLTIQQLGVDVVQATDYYPYGSVMTRYEEEKYQYGYQGQYALEDSVTGWNSFQARMYDPVTGLWLTTDPAGQFASPYMAMGNVPHIGVDPDGEFFFLAIGIAAAIGGTVKGIQNAKNGGTFIGGFWKGALIGGAAAAAGIGAAAWAAGASVGAVASGTASLGFGAGAAAGAAGGAAGGFVGGAGGSWLDGASFGDGLKAGAIGAGIGAVTGGLIGGINGASHFNSLKRNAISVNNLSGDQLPVSKSFGLLSPQSVEELGAIQTSIWQDVVFLKEFVKVGSRIQSYQVDLAVTALNANALACSSGWCARYVRKALEAGGLNMDVRPRYAKDYDTFLPGKGFKEVTMSEGSKYVPQKGDIVVMEAFEAGTRKHAYGHIQMYNGEKWVSDFTQRGLWPGSDYKKYTPTYSILRYLKFR